MLFVLAPAISISSAQQTCPSEVTPADSEGPFYVGGAPDTNRLAPEEQLNDPTNVLIVKGTVYGNDCVPMVNTMIEPWYAGVPDENGDPYSVAGSSLLYRARIYSDECGHYEYTSTFPVVYPGRPIQHIHYRVSDQERELLVTQLYFEGYIPAAYAPDASQIGIIETDDNGTRRTTFDMYVAGAGTANATSCGAVVGDGIANTPTTSLTTSSPATSSAPRPTSPLPEASDPSPSSATAGFPFYWMHPLIMVLFTCAFV